MTNLEPVQKCEEVAILKTMFSDIKTLEENITNEYKIYSDCQDIQCRGRFFFRILELLNNFNVNVNSKVAELKEVFDKGDFCFINTLRDIAPTLLQCLQP